MKPRDLAPIRRRLARSLIDLVTRPSSGEAVALDVVEVIGERMPAREDRNMRVVGAFVRSNIRLFMDGVLSFETMFDRFVEAAVKAPRGQRALLVSFSRNVGPA
jgi:hypothetical protein